MNRWLSSGVVAVLSCACLGTVAIDATIASAAAAPPASAPLIPRYTSIPYRGSHTAAQRQAQAAAGATVPLWSHTDQFANRSWTYQMVGKDPFVAQATGTTTVDTMIIPVKMNFTNGMSTDASTADASCSQTKSAITQIKESPMLTNHAWTMGGKSIGTTQYADAFRRANFYAQTKPGGINSSYHLLLNPVNKPLITINANGAGSARAGAGCGTLGFVDFSAFDNYVRTSLFPALASKGVSPTTFPIFVLYNTVLTDGGSCCILGYHSAFDNPAFGNAVQTYGISGYQATTDFPVGYRDVSTLSHEVSEWTDDPNVGNPTPPWGHIGQQSGCQGNLEVGDALSGTVVPTLMPNGITYHPQEMVFASWFYREPVSTGVNGWYSSNGTFTTPPPVCDVAYPPTNVKATGGNHQVALSWTAPYQTDPPTVGYRVIPYADGQALQNRVFNSTATTQTITDLTNGVAYRFKVQAFNNSRFGLYADITPPVVAPFANATGFIDRQTRDFLGHAATPTELLAELAQLNADKTAPAYVTSLRRGTDATTNVDPTTRLYSAYFLRIPDISGLSYWIGRKRGGTPLGDISNAFAASKEFSDRYHSLTNRAFVELVYTNVLGRSGDKKGVDFWTAQLDAKKKTRGEVMIGFSESGEYKTKQAPSVDVAVTWIDMLAASPDKATFDTWVTNLTTGGKTVGDLAAFLFADARYATRLGL